MPKLYLLLKYSYIFSIVSQFELL